jgi:hypothetical protein
MSMLRNIVMFMFALQLAIQVTNHIEIIPGVMLNTGQLSPFTTWYDPMNDIITTLNYTQQSLNPSIPASYNTSTGACNANFLTACSAVNDSASCNDGWVYYHNGRFNCKWNTDFFHPAGRCELDILCDQSPVFVTYILSFLSSLTYSWTININDYFTIMDFNTGLPIGQIMNIVGYVSVIVLAIINLVIEIVLVLLMTLINVTIGAIPFYINLFSLIDPVLGSILGICLGGMQMLVVAWAILEAVPQIQLKEK